MKDLKGDCWFSGTLKNGMYELDTSKSDCGFSAYTTECAGREWHRKLGHASYQNMKFLREKMPQIEIPTTKCEICVQGRANHKAKILLN